MEGRGPWVKVSAWAKSLSLQTMLLVTLASVHTLMGIWLLRASQAPSL